MTELPSIQINNPRDEVVMKITKDGLYINPDMAVDEAARKVIEAMQGYFANGWRMARNEALEEAARVCESELVEPSDRWMSGYSDACKENAAAIRALKEGK